MVMALAIFPVARLVSCDAFLVYLGLVKRVATAIEHGPRDGLWSTVRSFIIRVSVNLCACVRLPTQITCVVGGNMAKRLSIAYLRR